MPRLQRIKGPVLVTGAAGFIGRRLIMKLLENELEVIALDVIACPESLDNHDALTWIQGDIADLQVVKKCVENAETIFHLAAIVGDWGANELHREVTVGGTLNVFRAVKRSSLNKRIILASSIVVYGHQLHGNSCHEGMLLGDVLGPYSESKQEQERLAHEYVQKGLDIRIVRPANVYGAGSKPWVEDLCLELKRGVPALISGGEFNAGLVHVENVIDIFVRVARVPNAKGQIYNAADEERITWKQYMTDLAKICGAPKPKSVPRFIAEYMAFIGEKAYSILNLENRPPLTREALNLVGSDHLIDVQKAKNELGYKPLVKYSDGIKEIREYLHP